MLGKVWNFIKKIFIAVVLLLLLVVLIFLIPQVQTYYGKKLTDNFNEAYQTDLSVRSVKINYKGNIVLDELLLKDDYEDTIVYAKSLTTSLINLTNISGRNLHFSNTELDQLKFKLKQYKGEEFDEFTKFLDKLNDTTSTSTQAFQLKINRALAFESEFVIINENIGSDPTFSVSDLDFNISNFKIKGPDLNFNLRRMSGILKEGIIVEDFSTQFTYSPEHMHLKNLMLETPYSQIQGELQFDYERKDLKNFLDKVNIKADFNKSLLSSTDLRRYYSGFGYGNQMMLTGRATGQLNNLNLQSLNINGLKNTKITGDLTLINSFGDSPFQMDGYSLDITTNYQDLIDLLPSDLEPNLPPYFEKFGVTQLSGKIDLSKSNLFTVLKLNTELGRAAVNLNFENFQSPESAEYSGFIDVTEFNLSKFFDSKILGDATFSFNVNGSGFTQSSLNTLAIGTINSIGINGYTYRNIELNGNFKAPYFNGEIESLDPNFLFSFEGLLDASKEENAFNFQADVDYADLYALNIVKRDTMADFEGNLKVDLKGNSIDELKGNLNFSSFTYENTQEIYNFEDLIVESSFRDSKQTINIDSPDVISGKLEGEFKLTSLPQLFSDAVENLYFRSKSKPSESYQYIDFDLNVYNKIVEVFLPEIEVAPNTFIRGSIDASQDDFSLNFRSPHLKVYDNTFDNINIQIDTDSPLYNSYVEIEKIMTSYYDISDFNMINVNLKDTLFVRTEFKGGQLQKDNFNLSIYQTVNDENRSTFGFKRSSIVYNDNLWFVNRDSDDNNKVEIERGFQNFNIDSLKISSGKQSILLDGILRDSTYKDLKLNFDKIKLADIFPKKDSIQFEGVLDGKLDIFQEDKIYAPNLDVVIQDFEFNDVKYGQFSLEADGNKDLSSFNLISELTKDSESLFKADGSVFTIENDQYFDVNVNFDKFDLSSFSVFGADVISKIRGFATGKVDVSGKIDDPFFNGELLLKDAGLNVPYLNIDFDFDDNSRIGFDNKDFVFDNIGVTDVKYKTQGSLNGTISNDNLRDWFIDLNISSNNLVALDTKFKEGDLYYGTAFIDGNASIVGPTDEIEINVNAITQKNTVFKIPLDDSESLGDNSFIYFLTSEDKLSKEAGRKLKTREVKGLSLNFDLDITRDAEVEIVVDPVNGSSLKGRGAGTLLIEINTNGKFNMYGDFVAYEGEYNFKYSGLVQKRFEVVPGSNLTWNGDPVRANIDVQAKYVTEANPAILLENPSVNRDIPVEVLINLGGQIVQPDIEFSLNYPNLSSVVKSELEYRVQGRENTELQALSLVTQGTFYSQSGLGQNAITGNLIERASGIVDDIISKDDNKFKLGLNYQQNDRSLTQNNLADRVGLSIKTKISDRVLINGRFGVPVGGVTESVVFGDVEVNFLLNETGNLRASVFNRESDIQFIGEELGYTQGIGLTYTVDFDTFKELMNKILDEKYVKKEKKARDKNPDEKNIELPSYINFPSNRTSN
ncbi:translocation/assembly module TamB domain-containing protein [Psychroflexus montanilacus]|uniref:translocation/assembly module TamB domain-containing protein n=1 Tax=Psychroflexus montanilacus TaxID=2873598 RepID=UPI001CCDCF95|nr:translocation/assembly module TamB domain-containing protein [Psychroflexus montanilacus]MBZ9650399.1 translocation/assembly module TamB [Psychroflexus montanilacus]